MQLDIILKPFYILEKNYNIIKLFTEKEVNAFNFLNIKENNTQVYRVMNKGKLYKEHITLFSEEKVPPNFHGTFWELNTKERLSNRITFW
jgi:hypothetical protein